MQCIKRAICSSFYLSGELKECSPSLTKSFSLRKPFNLPFPSPFCTSHLSHCSVSSRRALTPKDGSCLENLLHALQLSVAVAAASFLRRSTAPPRHWLPLPSPPALLSPAPSEQAAFVAYDVPVISAPFTNRNLKNRARVTCRRPQGQLPPGFHTNTFSFTGHQRPGIRAAAPEGPVLVITFLVESRHIHAWVS